MFPRNVGDGRGKKTFSLIPYRNCTFFTKFFLKTSKFPNKKGTFDINLVFTATLSCTKRALFITKKGTFDPLKKFGGHVPPVPPPPVPTPLVIGVSQRTIERRMSMLGLSIAGTQYCSIIYLLN